MNIWITSDLTYQFLTIGITADREQWKLISNLISKNEVLIEKTSTVATTEILENSNTIENNLKILKILLDKSSQSTEFTISFNDSMLMIEGSRKSLNTLKDLADEFAKDDGSGDHVHLSYIDHEDHDCNWFSNKNIELILAVKSNF